MDNHHANNATQLRNSLGILVSDAKDVDGIQTGSTKEGCKMHLGCIKIGSFWPVFHYVSEMMQV